MCEFRSNGRDKKRPYRIEMKISVQVIVRMYFFCGEVLSGEIAVVRAEACGGEKMQGVSEGLYGDGLGEIRNLEPSGG